MFSKSPDDKKFRSLVACRERVEVYLCSSCMIVRNMKRFQLVGGRLFIVAKEPALDQSSEGCACVVKTAVVDDEVWSLWDRWLEGLFSRSRSATVLETCDSLFIRRSGCTIEVKAAGSGSDDAGRRLYAITACSADLRTSTSSLSLIRIPEKSVTWRFCVLSVIF